MASQSSPLTMALLGGGAGANSPYGMAMYDPQTMAAMQRLGFAQNLASEGMSSAPAYPMQALSRLGQALLGGVMLKQGFGDLQQLGQQRQAESAKFNDAVYGAPQTQAPEAPTPAAAPAPQSAAPAGTQFAANNPLNIRYAGQDGATNTNGFAAFPTPEAGQTATTNQFGLYADRGVNTLRGLISTWAPPNENDTKGYIARVSKETGIDPDAQIDLRNPAVATVIQHSMAGVEGNKNAQAPGVQYAQAGNVATDASTAPAPQQPQGAPQQPASPQVGLDNPNVQHALQIQRMAGMALAAHPNPMDPMHVQAQQAMEYSKSLLGIGQYKTNSNGTQTNSVSGKVENAAEPLAHYVLTPTGSVDTTGTHPPTFMPSSRPVQTPAGGVGALGPGGQYTEIVPPNNPGVAARAAAGAQGEATGKQAVVTSDRMYDLGRESDQAIGNIDYGINQLHEAAKGNINSGYFAPWLATAAAAGKSLGIDLNSFGIDPKAVGNVQSAQKTLGVVAGTILQNTIGKDSQITDAKIEHFIHTQPGIETDPQAIERIMNWARSQFTYNREMAMDAMQHSDPVTGMLPPGWRASFVKQKGAFAPIYDPLSQEMKQPQGQGPAAEMPKAPTPQQQTQAAQQPASPQFKEGQTATGPGGKKAVFRDGQWVPM